MSPWLNSSIAANGCPIQDNFASWFEGSVVVDGEGDPLVVYHGTKSDLFGFDHRKIGASDEGLAGKGFYFTYNAEEASGYALRETCGFGEWPNVLPVYVSVKNPLQIVGGALPDGRRVMDVHRSYDVGINLKGGEAIRRLAIEGGHDGVLWRRTDGGIGHVVAFRPEQIKSAIGNSGLYLRGSISLTDREAAVCMGLAREARMSVDGCMVTRRLAIAGRCA